MKRLKRSIESDLRNKIRYKLHQDVWDMTKDKLCFDIWAQTRLQIKRPIISNL